MAFKSMDAVTLESVDPVIQFGKHKGSALSKIPKDYLFYMYTSFESSHTWKGYAEEELKRRKMVEEHGGEEPDCTYDAVEGLSKTILLREFIQRPDKNLGIYAWCALFSKEVKRYGDKKSSVCWHYLGHGFGYKKMLGTKDVLQSVWKIPDE